MFSILRSGHIDYRTVKKRLALIGNFLLHLAARILCLSEFEASFFFREMTLFGAIKHLSIATSVIDFLTCRAVDKYNEPSISGHFTDGYLR